MIDNDLNKVYNLTIDIHVYNSENKIDKSRI